jgi:2,4-dienoyl-CoA reductase (NADPH2)
MKNLLLTPIKIGPMIVRNRIVMPAMHLNYTMDGRVTAQLTDFYRARATGGAGLLIVGGCSIDRVGGAPFLIGLYDDGFTPGLARFVADVKKDNGAKIAAQLYHAGRYAFSWYTHEQPIAPSPLPSKYNPETPREMTKDDIERVQQAYADAAIRAVQAGFDAVEILGGAGYLIAEFLSPAVNQRTDEYGGTLENRARFGVEVIRRARAAIGPDTPLLIRIAGHDFVPGGHTNREAAQAARLFAAAGVDAINVTGGWHESRVPQITMGVPEGAYVYLAAGIKRAVDVPVVASNRLGDPALAEQVLANGDADLIAMGRPLIADPDLPNKLARGEPELIRPCIACNQGCFDHIFAGEPIQCMLNPQAGFEASRLIAPTDSPKRVVVVGAGPAGVEAARVAAVRGHEVVLLEKRPTVGGALWWAGAAPGRHDFYRYVDFMEAELEDAGVDVRLGVEADVAAVKAERPDVVVVATGAEPIVPEIARSATHPNVVLAEDALSGSAPLIGDVVVVGAGSVGVETALQIAHRDVIDPETAAFLLAHDAETPERVKELLTTTRRRIYVCDLLPQPAKDLGKTTRWTILRELRRLGVEVHVNSKVVAIDERGVTLVGPDGATRALPCGAVVIAAGYRPRGELAAALSQAGLTVKTIGDAKAPRKVTEAVHEGFLTALEI